MMEIELELAKNSKVITIELRWENENGFFVWAMDEQHKPVKVMNWKYDLFAWHKDSYYGTLLPIESRLGRAGNLEGLRLTPRMALSFFSQAVTSTFFQPQWSKAAEQVMEVAPFLTQVIANGHFQPAYEGWKKGNLAWKVHWRSNDGAESEEARRIDQSTFPDREQCPDYIDEWLSLCLLEMMENKPEISSAWQKLLQTYPLLNPSLLQSYESPTSPPNMLEEDWLIQIGWEKDMTPFRCCLHLQEPEGEQTEWQLHTLLQDKEDLDQVYTLNPNNLTSLPTAWQRDWDVHAQRVYTDQNLWIQSVPWLERIEATGTAHSDSCLLDTLNEEQAWRFLTEDSLRLAESGVIILLPSWWERIKNLKPVLRAKVKSSVGSNQESFLGLDTLMDFDWQLATDGVELSEEEFRQLIEQKKRLFFIRGKWIQLNPEHMEKIKRILNKVEKQGLPLRDVLENQLISSSLAVEEEDSNHTDDNQQHLLEIQVNKHLTRLIGQLQEASTIPILDSPQNLQGTLRPYQQMGSSWLMFLRRFGLGGCLADDMGLGKTIQMITYLLAVREQEEPGVPTLLICPTSVLGNWQKELERFAPSLHVHLHYGPHRQKGEAFLPAIKGSDVVLTSYALSHLDQEELVSLQWDCICLDEAQNIKNAYTKQAKAIRRLSGRHRIALTGTPIENRLTELWSIMDFLNPGYLGSLQLFRGRFVTPIERERDQHKITQIQRLISPFLLRRTKKDPAIKLDLPDKEELKVYAPLTTEQASLYEGLIQDTFERLNHLSGMQRRGLILAMLTKLKQLCNHPALYLKEPLSTRLESRSNKMEELLSIVQLVCEKNEQCLIFTQYVEMGKMIQAYLDQMLGQKALYLHGGTSKGKRDQLIQRFQGGEASIFILSLKAGGTGLNLTAANHVIHFDRWWNPAVENQATDRAHRIGQKRYVQVHKLITLGTLEERIDEMLERKLALSEHIIQGENWITELSTDELKDLFVLRKEWMGDS
jgi:SNF2 family DNA or RNA helicase